MNIFKNITKTMCIINKEVTFMKKFNPGENAPKSGTYNVVDENGKTVYTVEMQEGNRLPPTQNSSHHFEIED